MPIIHPWAAAVAILLIVIGGWVSFAHWMGQTENSFSEQQNNEKYKQDTNKEVVFTQANKSYSLSSAELTLEKDGLQITGNASSLLLNSTAPDNTALAESEVEWNTVTVPRTKDYYVVLEDGTKVWMNAGSKLTFPNRFVNDKREILLEGEAYFEVVSHAERPFFVRTPQSLVRVTGTHFNVCCYADEPTSRITLSEGKVDVTINEIVHTIAPGQQISYVSATEKVALTAVNADLYSSWRNGVFEFSDISLQELAYRLTKWYDVSFEFENKKLAQLHFTGMVKKNYDIDYFLNVVQKTCDAQFIKKGNKVIVSER